MSVAPTGSASLVRLRRASDLPGSGPSPEIFAPALARALLAEERALVGMDFPFSLPAQLMPPGPWSAFLDDFGRRFPTADDLRAFCRSASPNRELKRRTDREARAPFSPYNLRLYRQTHLGIGAVLGPLVRSGRAAIVPMMPVDPTLLLVAEICPASWLKANGLSRPYKGQGGDKQDHRAALVARLRDVPIDISEGYGDVLIDDRGGDALDAVLAAGVAAAWSRHPERLHPRDALDALEARILF